MKKIFLIWVGCFLIISSMVFALQIADAIPMDYSDNQNISINAAEIDKIGQKSAFYGTNLYIQGKVDSSTIDFYNLGYLRKGASVTVELDQPETYGDCVKVRILDRMAVQSNLYPRWITVYNGQPYQYIIPQSGEYMIQIKGSYSKTEYSGVITIVN